MRIAVLLIALALTGARASAAQWGLEELYGASALATVRQPDNISVCLLKDRGTRPPSERTPHVVLSAKCGGEASRLLMAKNSYLWNMGNPCGPEWGARLIFTRKKNLVWVDFCFKCQQLAVSENSKPRNGEDFDPAIRPALLALFKSAFPKDRQLLKVQ